MAEGRKTTKSLAYYSVDGVKEAEKTPTDPHTGNVLHAQDVTRHNIMKTRFKVTRVSGVSGGNLPPPPLPQPLMKAYYLG